MKLTRSTTKRSLLVLAVLYSGICILVFNLVYDKARESAIRRLNDEQRTHARQAAHGIEEYFATWTAILTSLSRMREIVSVDDAGKRQMELFYDAHKDQIRSFTRMDEHGTILFTTPNRESIGKSLAGQKHVRELLNTRKPVVSDVFGAVQGFDAVALHVPVFDGPTFKGSIAIIINFKSLARRYLEIIRIGETGYAWVISRDGTELYCPVPGHTGHSVFENCKAFPSVISMVNEMMKGKSGVTTYTFDMINGMKVTPVKKHAIYMPIDLGNTFWSIVVASSEHEILASLASFRNRLFLVMGVILLGGIILSGLGVKAFLIIKEEDVRSQAEEELRANEQRYRHLFEQNPAPMLIYERGSLKLLAVNDAFVSHYGYSISEALALKLPDLYPDEEKTRIVDLVDRLSGHANVGEWHHLRKDGSVLTVVATSHDLVYQERTARVAVITDITERKQLEEQLRQSQKMEAVGQLAGGVAHDFNNMLSVILAGVELAQGKLPQESPVNRHLEMIASAAERSATITRQLLAFSRRDTISPRPVNLNHLIGESHKILVRLISEDINFSFHPADDLWVVKIDPSQLDQVLMNLVVNARDAMPDGGKLCLETKNVTIGEGYCRSHLSARPGEYVQLTVSDTGHGMDRETIQHIFEPFFTTKKAGKGTGLGLATVYGIVTQNNGFIDVRSEPGMGATFRICLPRYEEPGAAEQAQSSSQPAGRGSILLVEDEEMLLWATTQLLEKMGFSVIQAPTPHKAIEICERGDERIDLILTDLVMPEMNGREMADRIATIRPGIKVLFMSGYSGDIVALHGIVDKGVNYIPKPLESGNLLKKINEVLWGEESRKGG